MQPVASITTSPFPISTSSLLMAYEDALTEVARTQAWAGHLEAEIMGRIREAGAMGLPDGTFECVLETRQKLRFKRKE